MNLDDLEAEAADERPAFLDKKPKKGLSLDDLEAEAAAKPTGRTYPKMDVEGLNADRAKFPLAPATKAGSFLEGMNNSLSLGFGDELNAALSRGADIVTGKKDGPTYSQYRNGERAFQHNAAESNPWTYGGGALAGDVGVAMVPLGKQAGGVAGATKQAMKIGALSGAGNTEADLAGGDVGGFARDVTTSAATSGILGGTLAKFIRKAPERIDDRIVKSITKGDDTNAGMRISRKVSERIGEGGEDLLEMLDGNAPLKKVLATKAASDPRTAAKVVQQRLDHLTPQTDKVYAAIDDVTGGVDLRDVTKSLTATAQTMRAAGKTAYANAMEATADDLAKNYGDKIIPARTLRNYANQVGESAFATVDPKLRARAGQQVYKVIVGGIEDAGQVAGVDVAPLRKLNQEISTLIPIKQAFHARAEQEQLGRKSLSETIKHVAVPVAGAIVGSGHGHSLEGLAAGAAGYGALKAVKPLARAADWQLSKLILAARKGSTPAQLGQMAIELGLSRAAGDEIAKRIGGGDSGQSDQ